MGALSLASPQIDATAAATAASTAELARRGQIHATAQKFEASFLTSVLQTMFKSLSTAAPFGGGAGEDMWKSFLAEAMAKDMARRGGVGVAASVEREMLKLQGLNAAAQAGGGETPVAAGVKAAAAYGATLRSAPPQDPAQSVPQKPVQRTSSPKATLQ